MRSLRSPALLSWRHELRCTDDGEGVDTAVIDSRLGALGVEPPRAGQRGLFGRGLRDVWLAQGAGRIEGVRAGRLVESWFFPAPGDEPYAFVHVRDRPATDRDLKALGIGASGTRVTVPLSAARLPPAGRLRALVSQLVQLRPILEDPARALYLEQPGQTPQLITYPTPEPDPERPVLFDAKVQVAANVSARIVVRRAKEPLSQGFSRATRRGGLVIRSGRAAHETTLAGFEGRPGARHLYGEVFCEAIEQLQRDALDKPRPELVVKVDRSGLNEHHPIVGRLYQAIDRVLRPIVAAEEKRAGAHLIGAPRAVTARDQVGLRALNDLLKAAFDQPGSAAAEPGGHPADKPPTQEPEPQERARRSGPARCARPGPRERSRRGPQRRADLQRLLERYGGGSRRGVRRRAHTRAATCITVHNGGSGDRLERSRPRMRADRRHLQTGVLIVNVDGVGVSDNVLLPGVRPANVCSSPMPITADCCDSSSSPTPRPARRRRRGQRDRELRRPDPALPDHARADHRRPQQHRLAAGYQRDRPAWHHEPASARAFLLRLASWMVQCRRPGGGRVERFACRPSRRSWPATSRRSARASWSAGGSAPR